MPGFEGDDRTIFHEIAGRMEEEMARVYSEFMDKLSKSEPPQISTAIEEYIAGRFDVRARCFLLAIRDKSKMEGYLATLEALEKEDVEPLQRHFEASLLHPELVDARIAGRISYWKAEALRKIREEPAEAPKPAAEHPEPTIDTENRDDSTENQEAGQQRMERDARVGFRDGEKISMEGSVNLTPRQTELLRAMRDAYNTTGGVDFLFVDNRSGQQLLYEGHPDLIIEARLEDLLQLQDERYIRLRKAGLVQRGNLTRLGLDVTVGTLADRPDCGDAERAEIRSAWIDRKLTEHSEWTSDTDIEANGGPSYNTIQRYRSGATSSRDLYVRRKIANAFRCSPEEVPG